MGVIGNVSYEDEESDEARCQVQGQRRSQVCGQRLDPKPAKSPDLGQM